MATKLQELLEELKGLKRYNYAMDLKGYVHLIEHTEGATVDALELNALITKYSETTPTYKEEQTVRVIRKIHHNPFIVGFTVILKEKRAGNLWLCSDGMDRGFLTEEEFEPIIK